MTDPRFSVALASWNGAAFLDEQLGSIAAQSLLPHELVVQDDCSSDETRAIVERFAATAPFPVHLEVNSDRLGSTRNFDRAVERCSGTHILLCDQDDLWACDKLARLAEHFTARPELGLVFTNATRVDEQLRPLAVDLWRSLNLPDDLPQRASTPRFALYLLQRPVVTGATMAFDARWRNLVQPFPTDLPEWIHDRWIATLIALVAPVEAIAEPLILYRQHDRQQIGAPVFGRRPARSRLESNQERMRAFLASIAALRRRLGDRRAAVPAESERYIADLCAHLERRLSLPRQRLARVGPIMREYASGRYGRFSSGLASAIKDIAL